MYEWREDYLKKAYVGIKILNYERHIFPQNPKPGKDRNNQKWSPIWKKLKNHPKWVSLRKDPAARLLYLSLHLECVAEDGVVNVNSVFLKEICCKSAKKCLDLLDRLEEVQLVRISSLCENHILYNREKEEKEESACESFEALEKKLAEEALNKLRAENGQ